MSKAISGKGTVLGIETSAGPPPVFTNLVEVKTFQFSGGKNDTEDVTNSDSTGRAKEFIVTLLDSGQLKCGGNYVGSDTGQQALRSAFLSGALTPFQLTLPKTPQQQNSGDTFAFSAVVEESNIDVQYDKAITWSGSLKISGIITFTAGS